MRPLHGVTAMFIVIMEQRTSMVRMSNCVKLQQQAPPQHRRKTAYKSATSNIYAAGALCTAASQVYTAVAVQEATIAHRNGAAEMRHGLPHFSCWFEI